MVRIFKDWIPYHDGITCDSCGESPIYGSRYKCHSCNDFDLCESCYENNNFGKENKGHNNNHAMQLIMSQLDEKGIPHHNRWCNGCQSDKYPGIRYACNTCEDFDLCERCFGENRFSPGTNYTTDHTTSHKMTKHDAPTSAHHSNDIWTAMSIKMQNYFGSQLGARDWDKIDTDIKEEWANLGKKIGFAIYGLPTIVPSNSNNSYFGYDDEKEEHIISLRRRVLELNREAWKDENVWINFIFVSFWSSEFESMLPIIRIYRKKPDYSYFVEPNGRTYDSWGDFLDKNKLPECEICYPIGGWYQADEKGYCDLRFRGSAECDTSRKFVKATDTIATIGGLVGTGVAIVGLFTPLAPVVAGALAATAVTTGGYGVARGTYKLADRATHGESINPFDNRESFFCWFSIVGSVFAMGSMAGVSYASRAAMTGSHVGQSMRIVINTAIFGNLGINAVGIVANFVNVVERFENGEVPVLELFQLCASTLFFTNAMLNIQHASSIIKDGQKARLADARNQLPEEIQRVEFDRQLMQDRQDNLSRGRTGEMHGAEVTIGRLNRAMEGANWHELFGGNTELNHEAGRRHIAQPAYYVGENGENRGGVILRQAAINRAQYAREARYGGRGANRPSTTTVLAIPPHEFEARTAQLSVNNGEIPFPGTYYGYEVHLGATGEVLRTQAIELTNPIFGVRNGQVNHYAGGTQRIEINQLPSHARIGVNYEGNVLTGFQFMTFTRVRDNYSERDY